jgi:hypothetical protein
MRLTKLVIFTFFLLLQYVNINAQEIPATTNNGKKVILNQDDFTWRYVNSNETDKPCQTNKTGGIKIVNKTSHDLYFCYCTYISDVNDLKTIVIKANTTKIVNDLKVGNSFAAYIYNWKVTYEMPNVKTSFSGISGFQNGNFNVDVCSSKIIEIED